MARPQAEIRHEASAARWMKLVALLQTYVDVTEMMAEGVAALADFVSFAGDQATIKGVIGVINLGSSEGPHRSASETVAAFAGDPRPPPRALRKGIAPVISALV